MCFPAKTNRSFWKTDRSPTIHITMTSCVNVLQTDSFDFKFSSTTPKLFLTINETLQYKLKKEKVLQRFKSSFSQKKHKLQKLQQIPPSIQVTQASNPLVHLFL